MLEQGFVNVEIDFKKKNTDTFPAMVAGQEDHGQTCLPICLLMAAVSEISSRNTGMT